MAKLVLFGATGYTGGNLLNEALRRGHEVVAVARHTDTLPGDRDGVTVEQGSLHDEAFLRKVSAGADVLISAIPARELDGKKLLDAVPALLDVAVANGARLGVVGGAGSLHVAAGGPRLIDTPDFPEAARPEAGSHAEVLAALRETRQDVDWFYVSPAAVYASWAPGQRLGRYRVGSDVLLTDADGKSAIGGEDYAIAFLDEIDQPTHHRQRFTVAY
jgi:putative NADH-flavin reductase